MLVHLLGRMYRNRYNHLMMDLRSERDSKHLWIFSRKYQLYLIGRVIGKISYNQFNNFHKQAIILNQTESLHWKIFYKNSKKIPHLHGRGFRFLFFQLVCHIREPEYRREYYECHEGYSDKSKLEDPIVISTRWEESTDRAWEWDDLAEYPSTEVVIIVISRKKYTERRENADDHMIGSGLVI